MPGDAKLGLVVGVAMVIAVAVLLRRDGSLIVPSNASSPVGTPTGAGRRGVPAHPVNTPAKPLILRSGAFLMWPDRVHTVQEGETLAGLAQRYYGDGNHSAALLEANREQLDEPEALRPGTVLLVPELPEGPSP